MLPLPESWFDKLTMSGRTDFAQALPGAIRLNRRPTVPRFTRPVIASEARRSRWGNDRYFGKEIATPLCSER